MAHPLTDETCELIADTEDRLFTSIEKDNMRAAYDLGVEHFSKWIYENGDDYVIQHYEHNIKTDLDTIIADFQKAMRPQQQEEDN